MEYKLIKLTQGKFAKVDAEDFERVNQYKWYAKNKKCGKDNKDGSNCSQWVAERNIKRKNGKYTTISMHSFIMNCPKGMEVDHRFGDTLDNRKKKLRICTHAENMRNVGIIRSNTSGFKGVQRQGENFKAIVAREVKGIFDTPQEAAKCYDFYSVEKFGEYAKTNHDLGLI